MAYGLRHSTNTLQQGCKAKILTLQIKAVYSFYYEALFDLVAAQWRRPVELLHGLRDQAYGSVGENSPAVPLR